jgi:hypothetical protein
VATVGEKKNSHPQTLCSHKSFCIVANQSVRTFIHVQDDVYSSFSQFSVVSWVMIGQ